MISVVLHILLGSGHEGFLVEKGIFLYNDRFIGWPYQHSRIVTNAVGIMSGIVSLYVAIDMIFLC